MRIELRGHPVHIDSGGMAFDPAIPTLVFIHGAQLDHFVWKPMVASFAGTGLNVLAPDLPGHGQSGGPPLDSVEAIADWLIALLDKLGAAGTASITLAGHSMGSLVALEAAARLGERIRQIILIGTAVPMPVAPALLETAQRNEAKAMAIINQWSLSAAAHQGTIGAHGLWLPAINLRLMQRQPPGRLYPDLKACNDYANGPASLARIASPITIIAGGADRMTSPKAAKRLAAQHPKTRLVILEGVGHALMAEAPVAVCQAIASALSRE